MRVTLEELYKELESFQKRHLYLKSFDARDFSENISTHNIFPVLWVQPIKINFLENTTQFKMGVFIIDSLKNDNYAPRVFAETSYAFEDILNYYQPNNPDINIWVKNPTNELIPMSDKLTDKILGWFGIVTFETPSEKDFLSVPFNE